MAIELISFKTCPYVQRSVITLKHKRIDFDITFVDLSDPPAWFLELSPLQKVPVLRIDGEVLFESAVINEYLDDITGGELQPKDPLDRARNRAWVEFASNMIGNLYMMKMSKDEESYHQYRDRLVDLLQRVERRLGDGPWFDGENFSLCDTAFAPFFRQDCVFDGKPPGRNACSRCPRCATRWSTNSRTCTWRRWKKTAPGASTGWPPDTPEPGGKSTAWQNGSKARSSTIGASTII